MITEFIKKEEIVLTLDENENNDIAISKIEEICKNETIKSIELIFTEGTILEDVNGLFINQETKKLIKQKVHLNE